MTFGLRTGPSADTAISGLGLDAPIAATSQKTYLSHQRTLEWFDELATALDAGRGDGVTVVVIPPATAIASLADRARDVGVVLGAQDCSVATPGACTGELPAELLYEVGARVVEIGHAERRRQFGDTDSVVTEKVRIAVASGLTPIICVGEDVRADPDTAVRAVIEQLSSSLDAIDADVPVVVGYEPIWAIGADVPAGPEHINPMCAAIREWLDVRSPGSRVIYGGTAGPGLYPEVAGSLDGLFLGRRVHQVSAFGEVLDEMRALAVPTRP